MAVFNNNLLAGAGAQSSDSTYKINQSIRFNSSDNPAMSKTFSGAGTNKTWTFSCWFKRGGKEETRNMIFSAGSAGNSFGGLEIGHGAGTSYGRAPLIFYNYTGGGYDWRLQTSMAFADFSAWYHVTVVCDTTNAVASERARIYINGVRITDFSSSISAPSFPSLDFAGNHWMGTTEHDIGTSIYTTQNFDGYLAEIHNIDGQALDCNSFGEFNDSGIWIPKEYSGSYGTNGFKIDGRDASDLGDDESGNGNDFTTSGLASHDQVADSPTNNFCTINPIADLNSTKNTLSEGNLKSAGSSSSIWHISPCTQILPSGKWYFEARLNTASNNSRFAIGLIPTNPMLTANYGNLPSSVVNSSGFSLQLDSNSQGLLWYEYSSGSGQYVTISVDTDNVGTIGQFAIDVDNQKIYAGINGTYYNSSGGGDGNPSTGSNPTYSGTSNFSTGPLVPFIGNYYNSCQGVLNFGQDGTFAGSETAQGNKDASGIGNFKYSVPTGFKAICTKNLGS